MFERIYNSRIFTLILILVLFGLAVEKSSLRKELEQSKATCQAEAERQVKEYQKKVSENLPFIVAGSYLSGCYNETKNMDKCGKKSVEFTNKQMGAK